MSIPCIPRFYDKWLATECLKNKPSSCSAPLTCLSSHGRCVFEYPAIRSVQTHEYACSLHVRRFIVCMHTFASMHINAAQNFRTQVQSTIPGFPPQEPHAKKAAEIHLIFSMSATQYFHTETELFHCFTDSLFLQWYIYICACSC